MQPMGAHKGYGLALFTELLTGALSGGGTSVMGDIVSWCFELEKPNNVCHTMIAINPAVFVGAQAYREKTEAMAERLRGADRAQGTQRIYTPGEIEWEKHLQAEKDALTLPEEVVESLQSLSEDVGITIAWQ